MFMRPYFDSLSSQPQVLDVGIGDGRHVGFLIEEGSFVYGTDVSEDAISLTDLFLKDKWTDERYKLFRTELSEATHPSIPSPLHCIVCWEALHWFGSEAKVEAAISAWNDLLSVRGMLILTMPAEDHYLLNGAKIISKNTFECRHPERLGCVMVACKRDEYLQLFSRFNFKVLAIFKYSHGRVVFSDNFSLKDRLTFDLDNQFSKYAFVLEKNGSSAGRESCP